MSLLESFSRAYVINLPQRADRRRETRAMFDRVGLTDWERRVEFFPGIRPETTEGFPSLGVRGCFLSHLGVLKRAAEVCTDSVLIMEDDLEIDPDFVRRGDALAAILAREDWGFAYFGHILTGLPEDPGVPLQPYRGAVQTAHFVAIRREVVLRLVDHLEAILGRPTGHPDGGPMHVDGAYSIFRDKNPDVSTLVAVPNLGTQRNSSSDISTRWFDKVPGLHSMAQGARRVRRRLRR
ncbi:glycosyltransferase family 25 protein [Paludisphaera mucosa]|uniref:Glycosyltransferase family 25 protein n=1 Tax=Paludisphaera mucosa TaxID=3030827 RepID=A0ABT6F916_9BACT|nr:glycosyltransferase family 25 protein [Paludisphaera mucosa]MDG3004080.1 glycosyltransferase family 25 protein [Paludisphaera mucosa]